MWQKLYSTNSFVVIKNTFFQNGNHKNEQCCRTVLLKVLIISSSFIKWQIELMFSSFPCHFLSFLIIRNLSHNHDLKLIFCRLHFLFVPALLHQPGTLIIRCCWMWMQMKISWSQRFHFELWVLLHSKQGESFGEFQFE